MFNDFADTCYYKKTWYYAFITISISKIKLPIVKTLKATLAEVRFRLNPDDTWYMKLYKNGTWRKPVPHQESATFDMFF